MPDVAVDEGNVRPECLRRKAVLMARKSSLTNTLYRLARLSADGRAVRRGPSALGKRVVRRAVYRTEGRETRRIFNSFGL